MNVFTEKKLLQLVVALGCVVPLSAGLAGAMKGIAVSGNTVDIDSHFRYLSGLLLGIGIGFSCTIAQIERRSARFQLLTMIVVIGGLGRLAGVIVNGFPGTGMTAALAMELAVTPLLCLWQQRFAQRWIKAVPKL